jgi:hypothetical protein
MKCLISIAATIVWFIGAPVFAQNLPPIQTINPNIIGCNALGSQGPVSTCKPGWSYGCASSLNSLQIIATDGQRTSLLFQDTGTVPIVLCFGDSCVGNNGFVVQPGNSFLWSNMPQGNQPGRVATSAISIDSSGASTCTFLFTD